MQAVQVLEGGGLAVLDVTAPRLRAGEVLLGVRASALNRADLAQRSSNYPPPPGESEIMGLEAAGVVVELAPGLSEDDLPAGLRLHGAACALLAGGGYAGLVAVPAAMLMLVPAGWTWGEAAALPEAALTAYLNLFLEAGLQQGETVLVHAGASGVGNAAIRLAKLAGCTVVTTAGGPEKVAQCLELGADIALDRHTQSFREVLRSGGVSVDVVLDPVGAAYLADDLAVLAVGGRIVFISNLGGGVAELDVRRLMGRRAKLIGSTLRNRPLAEKVRIRDGFVERFGPALADGSLRPRIDSVYPLAGAEQAHERMAADLNRGKIVLEVVPGSAGALASAAAAGEPVERANAAGLDDPPRGA